MGFDDFLIMLDLEDDKLHYANKITMIKSRH
jgi:hypothetical protein